MVKNQLRNNEYKLFPYVKNPEYLAKYGDLIEFEGIQKLVMLDRYSVKDIELITLKEGDEVVVELKGGKYKQKGYGKVVEILDEDVIVSLDFPSYVEGVDVSNIVINKEKVEKPLELYWNQIAYRVAKGLSSVEKSKGLRRYWFKQFYHMLVNMYVIPAGRVLYGAGTSNEVTLYNCFVIGNINDSRRGISRHRETVMEIMSRGGGVGSNGSTLRPRGEIVKGVRGKSSGSVSWLNDLSSLTDLVQQGGCVAPYERVMTDKGVLTVKEIFESQEDIYALTHKGLKKITAKFDNGSKKVFKVVTEHGYSLDASEDHKFGVYDEKGNLKLVPLKDLKEGDNLALLLGENFVKDYVHLDTTLNERSKFATTTLDVKLPSVLDEKLAYILGLYHANGSNIKNEFGTKGLKIAVAENRPLELENVVKYLKELFGVEPIIRQGGGKVKVVSVYSVVLMEFLEKNGLIKDYSHNVKVPESIFISPKEVVKAYLGGLFAGDGSNKGVKGGLSLTTTSKDLAEQYKLLLLSLGIASNTHVEIRKEEWLPLYKVNVSGAYFASKFADYLDGWTTKINDKDLSTKDSSFSLPFNLYDRFKYIPEVKKSIGSNAKRSSMQAITNLVRNYTLIKEEDKDLADLVSSTVSSKVAKIEYVGEMNVYDFEVEDVHMLSFNGFYTSNSRRGAQMIALADWHPDIIEFIMCKIQNPNVLDLITKQIDNKYIKDVAESLLVRDEECNPIAVHDKNFMTGANISVLVSDDFMNSVMKDKDWVLRFPDVKNLTKEQMDFYDREWVNIGDVRKWEELGLPTKEYARVKAKDLWKLINISARYSAEPGVIFIDHCNNMSNSYYYAPLVVTNPCFTGDMRILTSEGYKTFKELEGKNVRIVNYKGDITEGRVWKTGIKPTVEVRFTDNYVIRCTEDHRFMLEDGTECEAKDLEGKRVKVFHSHIDLGSISTTQSGLVQSVISTNELEEVYDFYEPSTHWGVVEGVVAHNCGEQPLPPYGVCNLLAINMSKMVDINKGEVKWDLLKKAVWVSQRLGDNVIDHSYYFLEENEKIAKNERRIGKGVLGLADFFINLKIRYGSNDMLKLTDKVFEFIKEESYKASSHLAKEKGVFPLFDKEKYLQSNFVKQLSDETKELIEKYGVRNVCSLTVAPTGSIGTMLGVSTGLEPYFAFKYYRAGRLGFVEVNTDIAQKYFDENPDKNELPSYFVSAMDLTPLEHIKVQGVIQKHVDSAISKTCNAPRTFTVQDNMLLYELAWKLGCKGVTVYVDGSREEQVLMVEKDENKENENYDDLTDMTLECKISFDSFGNMIKEC